MTMMMMMMICNLFTVASNRNSCSKKIRFYDHTGTNPRYKLHFVLGL